MKIGRTGSQDVISQRRSRHFEHAGTEATRYLQGTLPNGLAFARNGDFLDLNFGTDCLEVMSRDGTSHVLADDIDGQPIGKVNFVLRDSRDRVWITVSTRLKNWMQALRTDLADGYLARLENGRVSIVADGFRFTNEIRFDANEEYLYVVETAGGCITRLRIDERGGVRAGDFRPSTRSAVGHGLTKSPSTAPTFVGKPRPPDRCRADAIRRHARASRRRDPEKLGALEEAFVKNAVARVCCSPRDADRAVDGAGLHGGAQSGDRRAHQHDAALHGQRGGRRDRGREPRVSRVAPHAGHRPCAIPLPLKSLLEERVRRPLARTSPSNAARRSPSRAANCAAPSRTSKWPAARPSTQGHFSEDIAAGIDEIMIRQPLGVCAIIAPFNFPGMIPFWFLPYAIPCRQHRRRQALRARAADDDERLRAPRIISASPPGRRQPRQRRPRSRRRAARPSCGSSAVSFVGSSAVARHVYARAAAAASASSARAARRTPVVVLRCRPGCPRGRHRRQRLRLRRAALPRRLDGHHRRRRQQAVPRGHSGQGRERASPATA